MNRFKFLLSYCFLTAFIFMGILTGCSDPTPIKIGFVGELSGRRSEIAVSVRKAVRLKMDEVNEAGGIKGHTLRLEIHDNAGDQQKCEAIIKSMIDNGIRFIVGPMLSQMAEPATRAIEGRDVLLISPTMSTDYLTGKDDNLLRTASTTTKQAKQLAEYAHKKDMSSVAVVYDLSNRKYTELLYNAFADQAEAMAIDIPLVLTIDKTGHTEMLRLAKRIKASKADAVLMCLSAVDAANLAQQLKKLNSSQSLLGVSWSQTDDLIVHGGRAVEGMVLISTRNYGSKTPVLEKLEKAYTVRYKQSPSFVAAKGYDAMTMLVKGLAEADEIAPTAVKQAILQSDGFQGAERIVKLDHNGDVLNGYFLVTVKDGRYVNVP